MNNNELKVAGIAMSFQDWPDPESHALIVYLAGCGHDCKNCQSPNLQNHEAFTPTTVEWLSDLIQRRAVICKTNKIVFTGGDPLFYNPKALQKCIDTLNHAKYQCMIYTGFDYSEAKDLINGYAFIKTGCYNENDKQKPEKTDYYMQLASTNQEIYDSKGNCLTTNGKINFKYGVKNV